MGSFDYGNSAAITNYTQTAVLQTSQTVYVPSGTKRIEALLCGGGGGGAAAGGGGFGGCQIYNIPLTGQSISLIVGTGGGPATRGGTTSVSVGGTVYAAVGGGGAGTSATTTALFGGGGNGGSGCGAPPFSPSYLWSAMDMATKTGGPPNFMHYIGATSATVLGLGTGMSSFFGNTPTDAAYGWGGGGAGQYGGNGGYPGASGGGGSSAPGGSYTGGAGGAGAGGGASVSVLAGGVGGSLSSISIWGLIGFGGGTGAVTGGGGGGGMLSAGANAVTTTGGAGGNGGGGGGAGTVTNGTGGNGFAMFRFYS